MTVAEVDRLVDAVERDRGAPADCAPRLRAAIAEFGRPMSVRVAGRAGSGRSSVAVALGLPPDAETAPIDAPGGADPDLAGDVVVYVLSDAMQPGDRRALAGRGTVPTLLILNKADAIGDRAAVHARCAEYTAATGLRTLPLVAAVAARLRGSGVTAGDLAGFRAPDAATAERWQPYGVECARTVLRHRPHAPADLLHLVLDAASGAPAVRRELARRTESAAGARAGRLLDELRRAAVRAGGAGDAIETFLRGPTAARLGLDAGLADPAVAALRQPGHVADPPDAGAALAAARYWRDAAGTAESAAARRAALRLHHGYAARWTQLAGRDG